MLQKFDAKSWHCVLWRRDPKTRGLLLPGLCPSPAAHKQYAEAVDPLWRHVVQAAAPDARTLLRADPSTSLACECGAETATRTHLTVDCASRPWTRGRRSEPEHRLLPLVRHEPARLDPTEPPPELVRFLEDRARAGAEFVTLAPDGGCLAPASDAQVARAAWAVSSLDGSFTCKARLFGADQKPLPTQSALRYGMLWLPPKSLASMCGSWLIVRPWSADCAAALLAVRQAIVPSFGMSSWPDGAQTQLFAGFHLTTSRRNGLQTRAFRTPRRLDRPMLELMRPLTMPFMSVVRLLILPFTSWLMPKHGPPMPCSSNTK